MKPNKVLSQRKELHSVLLRSFEGKMNLARIKFFGLFLCALCKVQNVCFEKLATAFDSEVERGSSLRRIQRFMAEYVLERDLIARLIFSLLPHKPPYILTLDRTNWKFGQANINILTLAIAYDGVAFPLLFTIMDKQGNSNTAERIALFSSESIECLVADREFVGRDWIEYLNLDHIRYYIRIRNNFKVFDFKHNQTIPVMWLFNGLKAGQVRVYRRLFKVNNELCYISGSMIQTKNGVEHQILISYNNPHDAHSTYKERWQIECAFKSLKTSGFNIENTHLTNLDRLEKLFSLVIVAFTWAYLVGLYLHNNGKPIRLLKHGYKAKTYFKHGLEAIANALLNPCKNNFYSIANFLSCS